MSLEDAAAGMTSDSDEEAENSDLSIIEEFDNKVREALSIIIALPDFQKKYDLRSNDSDLFMYVLRPPLRRHLFFVETFATVQNTENISYKMAEDELEFHPMFEAVIERYTKINKKPNSALVETRCAGFCYHLEIRIEAVPYKEPVDLLLVRHYVNLRHIWEAFRLELIQVKCGTDQLIGFPMPFEFRNVTDSMFDLDSLDECECYSPTGVLMPVTKGFAPDITLKSSLSYMSCEKVGPSITYLQDLVRSNGRCMSLSTALKIYDQVLCRIMVMHKYGIIHGNINPDIFNFGCGEATGVLYTTNFETSIQTPSNSLYLPKCNMRFAAIEVSRRRVCHFINDIESAFYMFLWMLLGNLPWDKLLKNTKTMDSHSRAAAIAESARLKTQLWTDPIFISRVCTSMPMEFNDSLYHNFARDVIMSLFSRVKECLSQCRDISHDKYVSEMNSPNGHPQVALTSQRKVIVTYFQFESISDSLRDIVCSKKIELLLKEDPVDRRVGWDLSSWCWSHLVIKGALQLRKSLRTSWHPSF